MTFDGVPRVGGIVICGRTGWIFEGMNVPLTREVIRLDLPTPSSPQMAIRTVTVILKEDLSPEIRNSRLSILDYLLYVKMVSLTI